jgi:hypothetical protein
LESSWENQGTDKVVVDVPGVEVIGVVGPVGVVLVVSAAEPVDVVVVLVVEPVNVAELVWLDTVTYWLAMYAACPL